MLPHPDLTKRVIGAAIEVLRSTGPGLLESVYGQFLALELAEANIPFQTRVVVPATYKGTTVPMGFRADIVVENAIIPEIKGVAALLPAHEAQILTYLRPGKIRVGLLINFRAIRLKDGLRRFTV